MSFIFVTHPDLPEAPPARVSEKAFAKLWEPRGFTRVEDPAAVLAALEAKATPTAPPRPSGGSAISTTANSGQEG